MTIDQRERKDRRIVDRRGAVPALRSLALVLFFLPLSVLAFIGARQVIGNTDTIDEICAAINVQSAKQIELWTPLVERTLADPATDAMERQEAHDFGRDLNRIYGPQECSR